MAVKSGAHPLDPLSKDEIFNATRLIKEHNSSRYSFKGVALLEPPKTQLAPYLDAERTGSTLPAKPDRKADVLVHLTDSPHSCIRYLVNLSTQKIENSIDVPVDQHANCDGEEMDEAERALYESELFQNEVKKLKLPEGAVIVADPWIYGADTPDVKPRSIAFLVYMRNLESGHRDSNHYAWPLPLVPTYETALKKITRVDWVYTGDEKDGLNYTWDTEKSLNAYRPAEYDPNLNGLPTRAGLKPLHITQPDGPSFQIDGHQIKWQDWTFRLGFNYREGITLHDLVFKGRQTFYRLSFSDMTVPYGDPRPPLHRKQAFDLGDAGAGNFSNSLKLGCDCLGHIKYFDGATVTRAGEPIHQEKTVCLHEADDGLLWKHNAFRTNHAVLARKRKLILQQILTVANYEYIVNWVFDQAGGINLEIKATGILSTQPIDPGKTSPYGTVVAPGVLATHHQHIFSVRIDPAVDGYKNSLVYDELEALPYETEEDKKINPYGTGFRSKRTFIEKEGFADAATQNGRVFKVINENEINPVSMKPVGYKIYVPQTQPILAHPKSTAFARADFADHHIYASKHREDDLFSGGLYTNQSRGQQNGLKSWIKDQKNIRNEDFIVWANFGLSHAARCEDWPVMPEETLALMLKPADFFTANPSLDVAMTTQDIHSTLVASDAGRHRQGNMEAEEAFSRKMSLNGTNGTNGTNGISGH